MISTTLSVNKKNYKNIDKQGPQPIKYPIVPPHSEPGADNFQIIGMAKFFHWQGLK